MRGYVTSVDAAPHVHAVGLSSKGIMWAMFACAIPAALWGVWVFGPHAALVLIVAVVGSLFGELVMDAFLRRATIADGSAALTGLLIGCLMPPAVPLYVPAAASLFAAVVIKGTFGGLGSNWMNPAAGGLAFAFVSWPEAMSAWGATGRPAGILSAHLHALLGGTPGSGVGGTLIDTLVGLRPGGIGTLSIPLIVAGGITAAGLRLSNWRVPVIFLAVVGAIAWPAAALGAGNGASGEAPLLWLMGTGVVFVAGFVAVDSVTTPVSAGGMIVYAAGLGIVCSSIALFGAPAEAPVFAVLFMNLFVPLIDRAYRRRRSAGV